MDREKSNINLRDIKSEGERVSDVSTPSTYGTSEPVAPGTTGSLGIGGSSTHTTTGTAYGTTETPDSIRTGHSSTTYDRNASSTEIKSDIDKTRSEMDQTLNELGEKLHPRNLFDELVGLFRKPNGNAMSNTSHEITQALQGVGSAVLHQVKKNPGPALLMGMGICWLLFEESTPERPRRRRRRSSSRYATNISPEDRSLVDARTGQLYDDVYGAEEYVEPLERGYMISETSTYYPPNPAYPPTLGESKAETTSQTGESITDKAANLASSTGEAISGAASGAADIASNVAHKVGEVAETAYEKAGEWAHLAKRGVRQTGRGTGRIARSTGQAVNQYGHQLGDYSNTLVHQAQIVGDQVRRQAVHGYYYSRDLLNDAMNTSMLGLGAAFLGIGLVSGLILPRTRREDEWMGDTSDTVKERAMETGEDILEQGLHVAGQTVKAITAEAKAQGLTPDTISEKLEHIVSRIQNAAYEAAQEEGLDVGTLRDKAGQVVQRATERVKDETQKASEDVQQSMNVSSTGSTHEVSGGMPYTSSSQSAGKTSTGTQSGSSSSTSQSTGGTSRSTTGSTSTSGEKSTGTSTVKNTGTTGSTTTGTTGTKPSGSGGQSSGSRNT